MDLRDYIRILRKNWLLLVLCTVLALGAAAAVTLAATPIYQAKTQLFVSARDTGDISQLVASGQFSQQRVKSYADIIGSPLITQPVIDKLGLRMTPNELADKISADAPLDTVLINVSVNDPSPVLAAQVANAVGQQFTRVVTDLEQPANGGSSVVKVSVVKPADVPGAPVSPRRTVNLALGLLVGLAVGVGGAVLRETLDTSVKTPDQVSQTADAPTLGAIAYDPEAPKRPLIVQTDPHSSRAEAFRQLRTNLQFIDVDHAPRSIVVTSSVPEEGKTTTACNLAITLGQAGLRVLLMEGDLRRPRTSQYFGLVDAVGVTSVLIGQASLDDAIQHWGDGLVDVLPAGPTPPNPSELLGSQQMADLLQTLERRYDLLLIDAPPLLPVTDAAVLSTLASGALLVVRHGRTKREQLLRAAEALRGVGAQVLGVVLNMTPTKGPEAYYYGYGYRYTREDRPPVPTVAAYNRRGDLAAADAGANGARRSRERSARSGGRG